MKLFMELRRQLPDAVRSHLCPCCGNPSGSSDQPNSKSDRNRQKREEIRMQPKHSVFISAGWGASQGWQNDPSHRGNAEKSQQLPEGEGPIWE